METRRHRIPSGAGWQLSAFQTWDDSRLVQGRNPVLVVPGYGINSLVFSHHPRGPSIETFLAEAGFEVWRADLRGQGGSVRAGGSADYGLEDLALTDLGAIIDAVLSSTRTGAGRVDAIGASLGGTLIYSHAALRRDHRIGAMVGIGSPVRWVKMHPLMRLVCGAPGLLGLLPMRRNREIAELLLPRVVRHAPWLLRTYLNPKITEVGRLREVLKAIDNPCRRMNRELAAWGRDGDLRLRGENVTDALRRVVAPLLCVVANADGLVPRETAEFAYHHIGSPTKSLLEVGTPELAFGHADLFVSNEVHARVLRPIAEWLAHVGETGASRPPAG